MGLGVAGTIAAVGATAAVAGAATQVAGAVGGGSAQSGAISQGQQQANQVSQQAVNTAQPLYQPFIDQGTAGLGAYADLTGVNGPDVSAAAMKNFAASPGYQYQVSEGLKAVDAGAASRGMLTSGQTLKAEQTLGSNLANQDFGNYMTRLNTLANFGNNGVTGFTNVLTGQANQQQSTDTSAAGNQALIAGNEAKGLTSAATGLLGNTSVQNGLTGLFSGSGSSTPQSFSANQNPLAGDASNFGGAGGFT